MSEPRWKTYISGKKYGPVDDETIRQWIAEHRVTATTQLWRPGMAKWLKAREVPEFALYFEETVAAMPALAADQPSGAPAPAPAPSPAASPAQPAPVQPQASLAPAAMYGDDDAPTVVQASPFLDVDDGKQKDETIRVTPTAPERVAPRTEPKAEPKAEPKPEPKPTAKAEPRPEPKKAAERPRVAAQPAEAPRRPVAPGAITKAKPPLPLFPFVLSLLALVPAASFGYLLASQVISTDDVLPFALLSGAVFGLLLVMIPPLFFSMAGLFLGLLGGIVALGCWVALFVVAYGLDGALGKLQAIFIDTFSLGPLGIVMGALNWCIVLVSLLAIIYFAASGKYRRRARA
jgi:hypothetical protein